MTAKQALQSYYLPVIARTTTTVRSKPTLLLSCNKLPGSSPLFFQATSSLPSRSAVAKCSGGDNLKDALSGMVGKQVEELLGKEENKGLLDELEKASERVEIARRELAEIERQELEAKQVREYVNQLETRASEIEECLQEISAAKSLVEEAERSLSAGGSQNEASEKDKERIESIKAAGVCALVGTLAGLPVSLAQVTSYEQLLLPLAVTFFSCALFGVTFRYAVRRDLDDSNLKTGAIAAFGFVKGLGRLSGGAPLELNPGSILSHGIDGAVYVSQSLLVFGFAAVSLDYCFKVGLISPFPLKASPSENNAE